MNSPETETLLARVAEIGPTFRERMRELDVGSSFPFQNLAEAQQADLHKLTVPREYGGFGYWRDDNYSGFYRILEQLAYWDTNTAQLLQVHNHAVGIVGWHATPEQRELFLPQIVGGAFCASLGSEAHIFENGAEHSFQPILPVSRCSTTGTCSACARRCLAVSCSTTCSCPTRT
ncbi:MAG: Acyl-CoA dehydrogenase, N-terminal domain protein [Acidimicrobiaceae bacterium]|nr:MAG: Acyl-CoA dehydrogenase, N-terminal domain protein [Acidimicrobiaceae bacterium]